MPTVTPVHVHAFGDWTTVREATCVEEGRKERSCACGEKDSEVIPATGHTVVTDPAVDATCTKPGKPEGSHCAVCGAGLFIFGSLGRKGFRRRLPYVVKKSFSADRIPAHSRRGVATMGEKEGEA